MENHDRRACYFYGKSDFLTAYENANHKIISKYQQSARHICQEGIRYLQKITEDYLTEAKQEIQTYQSRKSSQNLTTELFSFRMMNQKKPLIQHDLSTQNESKNQTMQTNKKKKQHSQESFDERDQQKDQDYIKKSLKKLGINQEDFNGNSSDDEHQKQNWAKQNQFKNKTIQQIIMESNRKVQAVISQKKAQRALRGDESSQNEQGYPITDYSSNESSNDNQYEQNVRQGTSGTNHLPYSEHSQLPTKLNYYSTNTPAYIASKITLSPKKSKSNAKRLYIRQKKIPKWAQDLKRVGEQVRKQKESGYFTGQKLYGFCVIERLDASLMFKDQDKYARGSSAKWSKCPQNQFIS